MAGFTRIDKPLTSSNGLARLAGKTYMVLKTVHGTSELLSMCGLMSTAPPYKRTDPKFLPCCDVIWGRDPMKSSDRKSLRKVLAVTSCSKHPLVLPGSLHGAATACKATAGVFPDTPGTVLTAILRLIGGTHLLLTLTLLR